MSENVSVSIVGVSPFPCSCRAVLVVIHHTCIASLPLVDVLLVCCHYPDQIRDPTLSGDMPSGSVDASGSLTAGEVDTSVPDMPSADGKKPKKGGIFSGIFGSSKSKIEVRDGATKRYRTLVVTPSAYTCSSSITPRVTYVLSRLMGGFEAESSHGRCPTRILLQQLSWLVDWRLRVMSL